MVHSRLCYRYALKILIMLLQFLCLVLMLSYSLGIAFPTTVNEDINYAAVATPLDAFQVQAPVRTDYQDAACSQVIVQHTFAASYGSPYVGTYKPPRDCKFTSTIFNLSVTSSGINYDRLGLLYFGDVEVWRTTTAMPVRTGIFWNFQKDVTVYDPLLRSNQKIIMQLDNLYDSVFTGAYNVTITALYYNDDVVSTAADMILPISSQSSSKNQTSVLSLPDQNATVSLALPKNVKRAVVSILASGNGAEEFWFKHVPTEYTATFNNTSIRPYGPWREVQLLIDGNLAGVSWPFPIIFTGGISPGLWVPIVGIDTYDVPSFEIDVSPWLGQLCDGKPHSFQLKVVGWDSVTTFGTVASNWWISGSVFLWLDEDSHQTTASAIQSNISPPIFHFTPHITTTSGVNTTLYFSLTAHRTLSHTSTISTSSGPRTHTWTQSLSYINTQNITAKGYNDTLFQHTTSTTSFSPVISHAGAITNTFSYPLSFFTAYKIPIDATLTNSSIVASLDRSKISNTIPILPYLTSPIQFNTPAVLVTRQNGSCTYFWNDTYYQNAGAIDPAKGTEGATEQWYSFSGAVQGGRERYGRHVKAVDGYEPVLLVDETFERPIAVPEVEENVELRL